MRVEGPFEPGKRLTGRITPTKVDPEVAELQKPHEGKAFELSVERVEPMRLLSFRWRPQVGGERCEHSVEGSTLIEFTLEDAPEGVLLTVTESGFDQVPLERRAQAFSANERGWEIQMTLIAKYLGDGS
jgi:uncharacterized protein YndB with AHSA1/START domain